MARDIRTLSTRERLLWGLFCIALGCYPVALGFGLIPDAMLYVPRWVAAGAGASFIIAGFMILLADHARANDLLAGVLLLLFAAMGTWVSLFSDSGGFSGGWPIFSPEVNELIGRWLFGLGALISLAMCVWAFRRAASGADAGDQRSR